MFLALSLYFLFLLKLKNMIKSLIWLLPILFVLYKIEAEYVKTAHATEMWFFQGKGQFFLCSPGWP
jgi:hypothetical protein